MVKVLIVGSGGREDAIASKIKQSDLVDMIFCAPGNAGMARYGINIPIAADDIEGLANFANKEKIDLTIVGPEVSLSLGIVDKFQELGLKIFGPTKAASLIESSKSFAKDLMKKYNIPTAAYEVFDNYDDAVNYISDKKMPIVIKYDGLAAGKGVIIAKTLDEAKACLYDMLVEDKYGYPKVVIEEFLDGEEFSYMCFVNNDKIYKMIPARDHKKIYDNDLGPNTGGMGAFTCLPFITKEDEEYAHNEIMVKTVNALISEGKPFTGVLYGGLIKTSDGIKVIEFNCRFGDPETEVVLTSLKSDLYLAICDILADKKPDLIWDHRPTLGVVLSSPGYPGSYKKDIPLTVPYLDNCCVYHMGTKLKDNKLYSSGGRVLMVVATANTLEEARNEVYNAIELMKHNGLYCRKDIGLKFI